MKEKELRDLADCSLCNKPLMADQIPFFWTAELQYHSLDHGALSRQQGLAMVTGSAALAMVMGPDEDLTKPLTKKLKLSICHVCAIEQDITTVALHKAGDEVE